MIRKEFSIGIEIRNSVEITLISVSVILQSKYYHAMRTAINKFLRTLLNAVGKPYLCVDGVPAAARLSRRGGYWVHPHHSTAANYLIHGPIVSPISNSVVYYFYSGPNFLLTEQ
jgi:hypothetical protein